MICSIVMPGGWAVEQAADKKAAIAVIDVSTLRM